jgi:hypothetical protein
MIHVIPYAPIDGIPSMKDSMITDCYLKMVADGTADTVFRDGTISNIDQFLAHMKDPSIIFCVAERDGTRVGIAWLNRIERKKAWGHFCLFSNAWGNGSADIGRAMVSFLIHLKRNNEFVFDIFFGIFPSDNRKALSFVKECGGHVVGEIPHGLWNEKQGKSETGTLIYYQRGDYHHG